MSRLDINRLKISAEQLTALNRILAEHIPTSEVWAYGSRVTGNGHEGSDLDLVLRNPDGLDLPVSGSSELKEAITQSRLPMLVDIHQWAQLPESFKKNIEHDHVVIR
jgi:predicted nucleotidyltransferase